MSDFKFIQSKIRENKRKELEDKVNKVGAEEWEPEIISQKVDLAFEEHNDLYPDFQGHNIEYTMHPFSKEEYNQNFTFASTDMQSLKDEAENLNLEILKTYNYFLNIFLEGQTDMIEGLQEASIQSGFKSFGDRAIVVQENYFNRDGVFRLPEINRTQLTFTSATPEFLVDGEPDTVYLGLEDESLTVELKKVNTINCIEIVPFLETKDDKFKIDDILFSVDGVEHRSIFNFLANPSQEYLTQKFLIDYNELTIKDFSIYFIPAKAKFITFKFQGTPKLRDLRVFAIEYSDEATDVRNINVSDGVIARTAFRPLSDMLDGISYSINGIEQDISAPGDTISTEINEEQVSIRTFLKKSVGDEFFSKYFLSEAENSIIRYNITEGINQVFVPDIPLDDTIIPMKLVGRTGGSYKLGRAEFATNSQNFEFQIINEIPYDLIFEDGTEEIFISGERLIQFSRIGDLEEQEAVGYYIDYDNKKLFIKGAFGDVVIKVPDEQLGVDSTNLSATLNHYSDGQTISIFKTSLPKRVKKVIPAGTKKIFLETENVQEGRDFTGEVPKGRTVFYLPFQDVIDGIEFQDKTVFSNLVFSAANVDSSGDYFVETEDNQIKVTTLNPTNIKNAGFYKLRSRKSILNYSGPDSPTLEKEFEVLDPIFSSKEVHQVQTDTLEKHGDYRFDYGLGVVESFSPLEEDIEVEYTYQEKTSIPFEFKKEINGVESRNTVIIKDSNPFIYDTNEFAVYETINEKSFITKTGDLIPYRPEYITSPKTNFEVSEELSIVPDLDLVKGEIHTAGRKITDLSKKSILKGSFRVVFFSDNTNCVFDRLVQTTPAGVQVLPIACDGINIVGETQRDLDKLVFGREIEFRNGIAELTESGDYSIDYKNGVLYTYDPIPEKVIFQFRYAEIFAKYDSYVTIDGTYDRKQNVLKFSSEVTGDGILSYFSIGISREDLSKLQRLFTPLVYGYNIQLDMGRKI